MKLFLVLTNLISSISRGISAGCFALVVLCLLSVQPLLPVQAEKSEPSVVGSVTLSLADGAITHAEFSAQLHDDGTTTGEMTLSGLRNAQEQNSDGRNGDPEERGTKPSNASSRFYFKAAFDCMVVAGTQAVMSGNVTESSSKRYIGQRVLLVVQDRGDGLKSASADRLTWGLYDSKPRTWVPSDAEVENDSGIATSWLATDAERIDDLGIHSDKQGLVGCQSFPFSAFSLVKIKNGDGDIKVRP